MEKYNFPYQTYDLVKNPNQDHVGHIEIDKDLKRKFDTVFSSLKGKRRTLKSTSGKLNINSAIDYMITQKDDRVFDREIRSKGGTVIILVDGSGSMRWDNKMDDARKLVSTLYKSLEDVHKITFKVIMYTSHFRKADSLAIVEINSLKECEKLVEDSIDNFGGTPTPSAVNYCTKLFKSVKGQKLLITLTDGRPAIFNHEYNGSTGYGDGIPDHISKQEEQTRLAFLESHDAGIKSFGVGIKVRRGENMKKIFRHNYVNVNSVKESERHIIAALTQFVKKVR